MHFPSVMKACCFFWLSGWLCFCLISFRYLPEEMRNPTTFKCEWSFILRILIERHNSFHCRLSVFLISRVKANLARMFARRDDAEPSVPATIARYAVSFTWGFFFIYALERYLIAFFYGAVINMISCLLWHSNSMGGDGAWDNRMSDMLKNFDLNSTEVKQQFGTLWFCILNLQVSYYCHYCYNFRW